jgi:hypothetical protein
VGYAGQDQVDKSLEVKTGVEIVIAAGTFTCNVNTWQFKNLHKYLEPTGESLQFVKRWQTENKPKPPAPPAPPDGSSDLRVVERLVFGPSTGALQL